MLYEFNSAGFRPMTFNVTSVRLFSNSDSVLDVYGGRDAACESCSRVCDASAGLYVTVTHSGSMGIATASGQRWHNASSGT